MNRHVGSVRWILATLFAMPALLQGGAARAETCGDDQVRKWVLARNAGASGSQGEVQILEKGLAFQTPTGCEKQCVREFVSLAGVALACPNGWKLAAKVLEPADETNPPCTFDAIVCQRGKGVASPGGGADPVQVPDAGNGCPESGFAPKAIFEAARSGSCRLGVLPQGGMGVSHGWDEVAKEAVRILAEIVVDRGTTAALDWVREKVMALLKCSAVPPRLPQTCSLVASLRVQEIATSRNALLQALVADGSSLALEQIGSQGEERGIIETLLVRPILRTIERSSLLMTPDGAELSARQVIGIGLEEFAKHETDYCKLRRTREGVLTLAALALLKCSADVGAGSYTRLSDCPAATYVDQIDAAAACDKGTGSPSSTAVTMEVSKALEWARTIAVHLSGALFQPAKDNSSVRLRLRSAIDGGYAVACMYLDAERGCEVTAEGLVVRAKALNVIRALAVATLEQDSNSILAAVVAGLELATAAGGEKEKEDRSKGLRMLGAIAQYAATYLAQPEDDKDKAHQKRVELLKTLTREMTDRTGRADDAIWSFGGSVRLLGGVRIGAGPKSTLYGPLGLTLGIGYQNPNHFLFEISPVDLGQYLSFSKWGTVADFEWRDVFSPTVTIAYWFGSHKVPAFIGPTVSYSPFFKFDGSRQRGAFNAGLTLGVYVPLVDLN